jgi:hypothetical protein
VNALLNATKSLQNENRKIDVDAVWDCVEKDKECQKLKMTEKYSKIQLSAKVKKCAKADKKSKGKK